MNKRCVALTDEQYRESISLLRSGFILDERLILNHIIILGNMFTVAGAIKLLFFTVEKEHHSLLKTFLIYLNYIDSSEYSHISLEQKAVNILRNLGK